MSQQKEQAQFIVGVDGGGTKTHYALYNSKGEAIDFLTSGATNHESLEDGMTGTRNRLNADFTILMLRNQINISQITHAVLGLAGVDTLRQHGLISQMLKDIGLTDFILCNDSFLGVKAGCPSGFGICAINGTGFSVGGIDVDGKLVQIGGFGEMSGDLGGGGQYSIDAFQAVYEHLYKDAPETLLQKKIFDYVGISDRVDFPEKFLEAVADNKCDFSVVGRFVFDAADEGDVVSKALIEASTREYVRSISAAITRMNFISKGEFSTEGHLFSDKQASSEEQVSSSSQGFSFQKVSHGKKLSSKEQIPPVEIVLAGSVFVKGYNKEQMQRLHDLLQEKHPEAIITITKLSSPPVLGALLWAFEPLFKKNKMTKEFRTGIVKSLHRFL